MWSPEKAASTSSAAAVSWGAFMFLNGFITIGILAGVAMLLRVPFIFPSLGATAFLFFFCPGLPSASPRNAICGTAIGILAGFIALNIFGLGSVAQLSFNTDAQHVLASALALALTGLFMILFKVAHPPAAATTLIVTLGIVTSPLQLLIIELAVALLALQAIGINRLAYIDYPLWQKR
jgi:CBS-domain-containing membrane protein